MLLGFFCLSSLKILLISFFQKNVWVLLKGSALPVRTVGKYLDDTRIWSNINAFTPGRDRSAAPCAIKVLGSAQCWSCIGKFTLEKSLSNVSFASDGFMVRGIWRLTWELTPAWDPTVVLCARKASLGPVACKHTCSPIWTSCRSEVFWSPTRMSSFLKRGNRVKWVTWKMSVVFLFHHSSQQCFLETLELR